MHGKREVIFEISSGIVTVLFSSIFVFGIICTSFILLFTKVLLDISKKYFDETSLGYDSPKLRELYIGSYMEYLKAHSKEYDVIITGMVVWSCWILC